MEIQIINYTPAFAIPFCQARIQMLNMVNGTDTDPELNQGGVITGVGHAPKEFVFSITYNKYYAGLWKCFMQKIMLTAHLLMLLVKQKKIENFN